jgi:hypothetical protein
MTYFFIAIILKNYEISRWIRYEFDDEASPENAGSRWARK